jgi:hypothetical protein
VSIFNEAIVDDLEEAFFVWFERWNFLTFSVLALEVVLKQRG